MPGVPGRKVVAQPLLAASLTARLPWMPTITSSSRSLPTVIGAEINGANGFWQITDAATTATAIENITNAKAGVAYCIEIGEEDTQHQLTIANSGKFANITAAWTPSQAGDYIMVILGKDEKFRELERRVGGKRTINKAVQPNVPGGR